MSADVADAKADNETEGKKRGGPRGERAWRDRPTARERVLNQDLATYIKETTEKDVSPETIRAVRFCLPKWNTSEETKALRENMDKKLAKAKLQDKREKALALLREAESELSKYDSNGDEDDEDEDEDEDTDDTTDLDSDDEADDPFEDDKVEEAFG